MVKDARGLDRMSAEGDSFYMRQIREGGRAFEFFFFPLTNPELARDGRSNAGNLAARHAHVAEDIEPRPANLKTARFPTPRCSKWADLRSRPAR